jgi:hypothetical protein
MAFEKSDAHVEPLKKTGVLEKFTYEETTPVIGREYATVNIVNDILEASDADALIRDLAITSTIQTHLSSPLSSGPTVPPPTDHTNTSLQSPNAVSSSSARSTT